VPYHSKKQLERLKSAVEHNYKELKVLRKSRERFLNAASGTLYPHAKEASQGLHDILGLMRQAAEAMAMTMAAQQPKVLITPSRVAHLPFADHFERAIDKYARGMHLGRVFQECVRNAFYGLGVAKVHMANGAAVRIEADEWMDPGRPYVGSVSQPHFNYDTLATDFRLCSYISDRYPVRFDDVVTNKEFNGNVRHQLKTYGAQSAAEAQQEEWGSSLAGGFSDIGQFYDMIYLADVFCPKEGVVYTYPVDAQYNFITDDALMDLEWDGSETGPYYTLNLGPIPDKTTPSAPAQNLLLLHNLINTIYRKLRDQVDRQKNFMVGRKGGEDDLDEALKVEDGGGITLNEPESVETRSIDGPNQSNFAFALNAMQQFSKQAGNLEQRLGLSSQADTAAQEGMMAQGVGRMEGAYQAIFHEFAVDVVKQLGKLLFLDNVTEVPMTQQIEGTDISYDDNWQGALQEGSRVGDIIDYDVDILYGSMEYRSARDRLRDVDETWDRVMAVAPLVMESGGIPNVQEYLNIRAKYTSTPEIGRLFQWNQMPPQEQQGGSHERQGPAGQGGEYIHKSVPSGQSNGTENEAVGQMMAASSNNNDSM